MIDNTIGDVMIIDNNRFQLHKIGKEGKYDSEDPVAHDYGTIQKIVVDNYKKNYVCIIEKEGVQSLYVLDRESYNVALKIDNIKDFYI